jgi:LacI family transcriptional regulator
MKALLELPTPPTAVFVAADMMAVGAMKAIREAGLDVPGDVSIVGFDDIQIAPLVSPPLTTIRQDKTAIGYAAADALVAMVEQSTQAPPTLTLPVQLVVRGSCRALDEAAGPDRGGGRDH